MDWEDAVDLAADYLKTMTTEEKVGQLFVVNLEQVDGRKGNYYEFHTCTKTMQKNIEKYHVGGVILFSRNIANRKQTLKMTEGFQNTGRIPLFICVDEEGGSVARIGSNAKMETTSFPTAEEIGKTKSTLRSLEILLSILTLPLWVSPLEDPCPGKCLTADAILTFFNPCTKALT